jgi:alpha-tubulin suppressor-like RCC1 family protein
MGHPRPSALPGAIARVLVAACLLVPVAAGCTGPSGATSPAPAGLPATSTPTSPAPTGAATPSVPATPTQPTDTVVLSAGGASACVLDENAGLSCWGAGIVGDGTITPQNVPRHVVGLTSGVTSVGIGRQHTCAIVHGAVECWGTNDPFTVGDGTAVPRVVAVPVPGLASGGQAVVGGMDHSCVLMAEGTVKCWGSNSHGQLGDGTTTDRSGPTDVVGLPSGVVQLAAGDEHTCAVTTAGGVLCWGRNNAGQLGDGTTKDRTAPVAVGDLASGVRLVAASTHDTCAVTTAGGLLCWGDNKHGQVGDGSTTDRRAPVKVADLASGVDGVALGSDHACAVTDAGAALCWGDNAKGQLGDGTTVHRTKPTPVKGLQSGVHEIVAGWSHSCALAAEGTPMCWGGNTMGQLGDGLAKRVRLTPNPVTPAPAAAPFWKTQSDDFTTVSANWWTGCDKLGCIKTKDGTFTIRQKVPRFRSFQVFEDDVRLRSVSMTFDLRKLTTKAREASIGLSCMIVGNPGEETAYYDLRLRSDGGLSFAKYSGGEMSTLAEWVAPPGSAVDDGASVSLGCESVDGRVRLAGRLGTEVYETADSKSPLAPGRASMLLGQRGKGTSVTVVDGIEVVGEVTAR